MEEQNDAKKQTSIDIDAETEMMHVQINLVNGPVNAYGTLQFAMENASRYFATKQINKLREEKQMRDSALNKLNLHLPGKTA